MERQEEFFFVVESPNHSLYKWRFAFKFKFQLELDSMCRPQKYTLWKILLKVLFIIYLSIFCIAFNLNREYLVSILPGKALRTLVDIVRLAEQFNKCSQSRAFFFIIFVTLASSIGAQVSIPSSILQ